MAVSEKSADPETACKEDPDCLPVCWWFLTEKRVCPNFRNTMVKVLTFTILVAIYADDKFIIFFLIFP